MMHLVQNNKFIVLQFMQDYILIFTTNLIVNLVEFCYNNINKIFEGGLYGK